MHQPLNMGKIYTTKIDRFYHGMNKDIRTKDAASVRLIKHFDALTYPHRLVPNKSSESGQDTTSRKIYDFVYVSGKLFGLGTVATDATMFYQNDIGSATWSATANNVTTIGEDKLNGTFLIYYAKTGKIYGCTGSTTVFGYDPTGSTAWVEQSVGVMANARAIVHSKDDIMYVGYGYKIATNNNGSWTTTALTLPSRYSITALCEYGNYLAIGVRSNDEFQDVSRVFLWDRDSSVATLDESIDWGIGNLRLLEQYEGRLIGASYYSDGVFGGGATGSERLIIKTYDGSVPNTAIELVSDVAPTGGGIYGTRFQKSNDRLYFLATITIDGTAHRGLWSIGRISPAEPLAITLEYLPNNDTAVTSLDGFYIAGSFIFIAYDGAGAISKTDNASSYTATSIYESPKYDLDDASVNKKLVGVSVTHTSLASGASVVVKYKKDTDANWTTLLTSDTDGEISDSAVNIESTGVTLPEFKEIQFRLESTGGTEITGLLFDAEVTGRGRPY